MRKIKFVTLLLPVFLLLLLCGCGGHSEYYENGYKAGVSEGKSAVRNLWRITNSSEHKYISSSNFDAEVGFNMMKQSTVWGLDESHESEFHDGFITGYQDGVNELLGNKSGSSSRDRSSGSGFSLNVGSGSGTTGIGFWQWLLILVIATPIVWWLGLKTFGQKDEDNGENSSQDNGGNPVLVNPWKSLLLVIFVFLFNSFLESEYDLRVNNWSPYFIEILCIIAMIAAYDNAKKWSKQQGSRFFCGVIKFLAVATAILYAYCFCMYLYTWICE